MTRHGWTIVAIAALALPVAAAVGGSFTHGRQVLHADDLRRAGVLRLGDILLLADEWDLVTEDGYTWDASPLGGGTIGRPEWTLAVDGVPVAIDVLGSTNLNRLPLAITDVDSVEIVTRPVVIAGRIATGGVVHLHTRRPTARAGAAARYMVGSETGDPGPYRFTELSTRNVDRIGHDTSVSVSASDDKGSVAVSGVDQTHLTSDPATGRRHRFVANGRSARIDARSVGLRLTGPELGPGGARVSGRLLCGGSRTRDFLHLEAHGGEVPVRSTLHVIAADVARRGAGDRTIALRAAYTRHELETQPNAFALDVDWRQEDVHANVAWADPARGVSAGVVVRHRRVRDDRAELTAASTTVAGAFASFVLRPSPGLTRTAAAEVYGGHRAGAVGFAAAILQTWSPASRHRVDVSVSVERRPGELADDVVAWTARGFGFLAGSGVDVVVDGMPRDARRIAADAGWEMITADRLVVGIGGFVRDGRGITVDERKFTFDPDTEAFRSPVQIRSDIHARHGGLTARVDWRPDRRVRIVAGYRFTESGGDAAARRTSERVPRHQLRAVAGARLDGGLHAELRLSVTAATHWPAFVEVAEASGRRYRADLDAGTSLDLAIEKWLGDRHLRAHLLLRNLLDDDIRYHPAGAVSRLGAYFQLEFVGS